MKKSFENFQKGFTLMEVMVSVTIFTLVVTVGIGSLFVINSANRQARVERQAIDSLTYMLESMSRRIRTASSWSPSNNYSGTSNEFSFIDQDGIEVTYRWATGDTVEMDITNPPGILDPDIPDGVYQLTPEDVLITTTDPITGDPVLGGGLYFTASGINPDGTGVGYLQINLTGLVAQGNRGTHFSFQTGVSKRVVDYPVVVTP